MSILPAFLRSQFLNHCPTKIMQSHIDVNKSIQVFVWVAFFKFWAHHPRKRAIQLFHVKLIDAIMRLGWPLWVTLVIFGGNSNMQLHSQVIVEISLVNPMSWTFFNQIMVQRGVASFMNFKMSRIWGSQ